MTDVFSVASTIKYRAQAGTWPPEKRSAMHCTSPRLLPGYTEKRSDISRPDERKATNHKSNGWTGRLPTYVIENME